MTMPTVQNAITDLRIMIVEDNPFTAIEIGKILDSFGITRTTLANNGREALDLLNRAEVPCDVILLDLRMPRMGGVEFLYRLADKKYTGKVMVLSGADEETFAAVETLARQHNISLLGCLHKPPDSRLINSLLMQIATAPEAEPVHELT